MSSTHVSASRTSITRKEHRELPLLPSASRFETLSALKAVIPARAAMAGFAHAIKQSPLSKSAIDAFSIQESVAALQLQGDVIDLAASLQEPISNVQSRLSRLSSIRQESHRQLISIPVSSTLAIDLATQLEEEPVSIRRGELNAKSKKAKSSSNSSPKSSDNQQAWQPMELPIGAERLQVLVENWQGFIQQDSADLDPLLLCAVAHGQWQAISPFTASNVVVGHLLTSLLMCEEDLLPAPVLPFSLYFSKRADQYWKHLHDAVVLGNTGNWLQFFMTAITEASLDATSLLLKWEMQQHLPKEPSPELLAVCIRPSFGLAELSEGGLTRRQTASSWMQRLVAAGVLSEIRIGKQKRYINIRVMDLLAGRVA